MTRPDGRLLRSYRDGDARIPAFLDDYAAVAHGRLELATATGDARHLARAEELARSAVELFSDPRNGGFLYSASDAEQLVAQHKEFDDNPTPSGNSLLAHVLLRLGRIHGDRELENLAAATLRIPLEMVGRAPHAFGQLLSALDLYLSPPREVAVIGPRDDAATAALRDAARRGFHPTAVYAFGDGSGAPGVPLLEGKGLVDGRPAVYICERFACRAPLTDADCGRRRDGRVTDLEALKVEAGAAAVDRYVRSGMRLGLGSGSTAAKMLDALGERLASGVLQDVAGVPTSAATAARCGELGIPLLTLDDVAELDVVIDGADEIGPHLDLIKGLGGAHLREKVVASAARRMVVVADETKIVIAARRAGAAPGRGDPLRDSGRGAAAARAGVGAGAARRRRPPVRHRRGKPHPPLHDGSSGSTPRRWRATSRTSRASSTRVLPRVRVDGGRRYARRRARAGGTAQPPLHDGDGLVALVDQDVAPAELRRRRAERARSRRTGRAPGRPGGSTPGASAARCPTGFWVG